MKIKVTDATGKALDYLAAQCEDVDYLAAAYEQDIPFSFRMEATNYSTDWNIGGPIIERENITVIRADDVYGVEAKGFTTNGRMSWWFAETSQWVGHSICTSYEGEHFDPAFMIDEADGHYGPTPLIAAMRCYVASRLGRIAEVPDEMMI